MQKCDPMLPQVRVNDPCTKKWEEMAGGESCRFCAHCAKHVHNLSALAAHEAEKLLQDTSGKICVRYEADAEGRPITRPEPCPSPTATEGGASAPPRPPVAAAVPVAEPFSRSLPDGGFGHGTEREAFLAGKRLPALPRAISGGNEFAAGPTPWWSGLRARLAGLVLVGLSLVAPGCAARHEQPAVMGEMIAPDPSGQQAHGTQNQSPPSLMGMPVPTEAQPSETMIIGKVRMAPDADTSPQDPPMIMIGDAGIYIEGKANPSKETGSKPR